MYGTTALFLERLNIDSIVDLPELGDFVPEPDIVEALENGLRFDPEIPDAPSEKTSDAQPAEVSADEVVIDLRDGAVKGAVASADASSEE